VTKLWLDETIKPPFDVEFQGDGGTGMFVIRGETAEGVRTYSDLMVVDIEGNRGELI